MKHTISQVPQPTRFWDIYASVHSWLGLDVFISYRPFWRPGLTSSFNHWKMHSTACYSCPPSSPCLDQTHVLQSGKSTPRRSCPPSPSASRICSPFSGDCKNAPIPYPGKGSFGQEIGREILSLFAEFEHFLMCSLYINMYFLELEKHCPPPNYWGIGPQHWLHCETTKNGDHQNWFIFIQSCSVLP